MQAFRLKAFGLTLAGLLFITGSTSLLAEDIIQSAAATNVDAPTTPIQPAATNVRPFETADGRIVFFDHVTNAVKIQSADGKTRQFYLDSTIPIMQGNVQLQMTDLKLGNKIRVTYKPDQQVVQGIEVVS